MLPKSCTRPLRSTTTSRQVRSTSGKRCEHTSTFWVILAVVVVLNLFGLINYGCCETLHNKIALLRNTKLSARQIAEQAMEIAGKICIFTNDNVTYEELE